MEDLSHEGPITKVNIGRLTNAIFSFTLLLLFKNIRTPAYADYVDTTTVNRFGLMQAGDILSFLDAFLIIGMVWILVFHLFHQIRRVDRPYIYLHLFLLMMVICIPLTNYLSGMFEDTSPFSIFFHLNMLIIGLLLAGEWHHAKVADLVYPGTRTQEGIGVKIWIIPLASLLGIWLLYQGYDYNQDIYYLCMIFFPLISEIGNRRIRRGVSR